MRVFFVVVRERFWTESRIARAMRPVVGSGGRWKEVGGGLAPVVLVGGGEVAEDEACAYDQPLVVGVCRDDPLEVLRVQRVLVQPLASVPAGRGCERSSGRRSPRWRPTASGC